MFSSMSFIAVMWLFCFSLLRSLSLCPSLSPSLSYSYSILHVLIHLSRFLLLMEFSNFIHVNLFRPCPLLIHLIFFWTFIFVLLLVPSYRLSVFVAAFVFFSCFLSVQFYHRARKIRQASRPIERRLFTLSQWIHHRLFISSVLIFGLFLW